MKQRTWWIIGIVIVIILIAAWYFTHAEQAAAPVTSTAAVSSASSTSPITATFACAGGKTITATFYQGAPATTTVPGQPPTPTGSVALAFSDAAPMTLMQTISADGGRYANSDGSFVFWDKGQDAMVLQDNQQKDYTDCTTAK